jgi:hypothetical protein
MNRENAKTVGSLNSILLVLLALALGSTALAGGFQLSVETPPDGADAAFKNAVLLVRTLGCYEPADATVMATAEGLVNGRHQTVKLQLKSASKGIYAIHRQWPAQGVWILAINGNYLGLQSSVLVELDAAGQVQKRSGGNGKVISRISPHKLSRAEIEAALKAQAAKLENIQQVAK